MKRSKACLRSRLSDHQRNANPGRANQEGKSYSEGVEVLKPRCGAAGHVPCCWFHKALPCGLQKADALPRIPKTMLGLGHSPSRAAT